MSKKVIFSTLLSLVCLALLGVFLSRKSTTPVDQSSKLTENIKTKSPKKRVRQTYIQIGNQPETDDEKLDPADWPIVKNKRKPSKTRTISYSDPVNDRILGDPKWAATTPKAELEKVEKAFETPPEDPEIISLSRQRSIDVIKPIVNRCYRDLQRKEPTAKGRIAVEWLAGKNGRISNVKLGPNVDLRFPSFTNCILNRTVDLTFDTNAEDIFVEYPFAFL